VEVTAAKSWFDSLSNIIPRKK